MRFLARFRQGELPLARLEAFSDGVFAIVVTLLVLEIKVPTLDNPGSVTELAHELVATVPKLLSWLISFVIVCKFWLNHHDIIKLANHTDFGMAWLNSLFLMFQSFIPFPTALLGSYPSNPLAVSLFGVVMAVNTLAFMALHAYILRNLARPSTLMLQDPHVIRKSLIGPSFYLLGSASAWLSIPTAFALYMITPLFFITPPQRDPETSTSVPAAEEPY